jgi:hypothetical protein
VDGAGNIYIAELGNRIRKVNTSGIITTVAGNGTAGYTGDGGPATSASLYYPVGVAVDGAGNIYISDSGNYRIRKVNTSGVITTVAGNGYWGYTGDGGPATAASLWAPKGVAVDGAGNIYISDYFHHSIRKVFADLAAPLTTATAADYSFGNWTSSGTVSVTLSADDGGGSGIVAGYPKYCVDTDNNCTPSTSYSGAFDVTCASRSTCTQYVRFYAMDNFGNTESVKSSVVKQDLQLPTDGTLTARTGSAQTTLNWTGFSDAWSGVTSYKLVYSTSGIPASCLAGTAVYEGPATTYTHTGLTVGMIYSYRVCAIDAAGNMSAGATASAQPVEYPWTIVDGTKESCVTSTEMLHSALYDAEADGYNNNIKIVEGTYKGNFIYSGSEEFDLAIEGGYAPGCATLSSSQAAAAASRWSACA